MLFPRLPRPCSLDQPQSRPAPQTKATMPEEPDAQRKSRIKAARVKSACDSIVRLASELPHEQAQIIRYTIDTVTVRAKPESDLKPAPQPSFQLTLQPNIQPAPPPRLKTKATPLFTWDKLPGEVKNAIYKLLLVSDKPIRPLCKPAARYKPRLQGQVLRLSKSIYKEALPILLGDNTFILTTYLDIYLGFRSRQWSKKADTGVGTSPPDRAAMVRKLIIESGSFSERKDINLNLLHGLTELILLPIGIHSEPGKQVDAQDWEKICASNHRLFAVEALMTFVRRQYNVTVYLIGFQNFEKVKMVRSLPG